MPHESIFHKLVKNENSYTQLLCNIIKRDAIFRSAFLGRFGGHLEGLVKPSHIHSQKRLDKCGQADIFIKSPGVCLIIEVKTEPHRGRTDKQMLDTANNYRQYLENQKSIEPSLETWLVFLVPAAWIHRADVKREIEMFERDAANGGLKVMQILWEEMPELLPEHKGHKDISLSEDFRLLLDERFGPIGFDPQEATAMFNQDFPLRTVLKLNKFIDEVRDKAGSPAGELEIYKDEFGFYLNKKGKEKTCWLYFGCWLSFWENTRYPICFGVEAVSPNVREAFARALKDNLGREAMQFEGDWLMGWFTQEELSDSNAAEMISQKLLTLWESMSESAD